MHPAHPWARFARSYGDLVQRSRIGLQVSPTGSEQRYTVNLMGVLQSGRTMLVSAPANPDKSLIAVRQGQVMACQWLSAAAIFQFQAAITKLILKPAPVMCLGELHAVRYRALRTLPRVPIALSAVIRTP
jgi:hypothetical protein